MKQIILVFTFFQSLFLFSQEKKLEGIFENTPNNIIQLLDRKLLKDTLSNGIDNNYSKFQIKLINKNELSLTLYNNDSTKINRIYKYRLENNSYLLKNQNSKPLLIPYIAGAIDIRKLYLSLDESNNLNINLIEKRSGAILLVGFLDWKTKQNKFIYNRIK